MHKKKKKALDLNDSKTWGPKEKSGKKMPEKPKTKKVDKKGY